MITPKKFTKRQNFMRLIEYLNKNFKDTYYFRGQSDATWELKSSYLRLAEKHIKVHPYMSIKNQIEFGKWYLLDELVGRLHLLTNEISEEDDCFSKLSFLQHFGAHTHIIDFTFSPFVALYFSLSEEVKTKRSAIYALKAENFTDINEIIVEKTDKKIKKLDPKKYKRHLPQEYYKNDYSTIINFHNDHFRDNKKEILEIYRPRKSNTRIQIQQGLFMIPTNAMTNVESLINNVYFKNDDVNALKITYPREWCKDIYEYLNKHNINAETLFPGLEGYIRAIKENIIYNDLD
ncbi:MAG: FRG domain-containing protein [Candidatus Delongbacteria bacterium]|jgi:hypothetical protein|nr:FRG domain-containing protein [Candidatus Delongbacteria bacterium]